MVLRSSRTGDEVETAEAKGYDVVGVRWVAVRMVSFSSSGGSVAISCGFASWGDGFGMLGDVWGVFCAC